MSTASDAEFEGYYTKYYQQIFRYILKHVTNQETAEDITMEVFAKCYENFSAFDPSKASFATWAYVIVNNRLKNYYRDRKEQDELDENTPDDRTFEDTVIRAEYLQSMRDELARALKTLNEIQRSIIIYKYFKNKTSVEISELTGLTPTNVRVNLSRATIRLRAYFDSHDIAWEL